MIRFTMPPEKWDERNPDKQAIRHLIQKHRTGFARLHKLKQYYMGQHAILGDTDRGNRLVCNHAKDITDTASSYFIGNPITYTDERKCLPSLSSRLFRPFHSFQSVFCNGPHVVK